MKTSNKKIKENICDADSGNMQNIEEKKKSIKRLICHGTIGAVSLLYSLFILSVSTTVFKLFAGLNLILIVLNILLELTHSKSKFLINLALILTYLVNMTLCYEVLGNGAISYVLSFKMILNILLYAAPYAVMFMFTNSIRASSIVSSSFWLILSSANFFLTEVRGRPLFLSDLFSLGTALNVADEYKFNVTLFYVITVLYMIALIVYIYFITGLRDKTQYKFRWILRYGWNIGFLLILFLLMSSQTFLSSAGVTPYFWSHKVNGFPLNFVMDLKYSNVEIPDDYSPERIEEMNEEYSDDETVTIDCADKKQRPNVIIIMDESFADLRVIGDFDTNCDVTPFMDTLYKSKSVVSGYSYVSVFGGGTANSEYEMLTGDNVYMYPQGSVPYQVNFKNVSYIPSIVTTFNSLGYRTIAMHPYLASGWNRPNIYSYMRFNEQYYIDDFKASEVKKLRAYVSDESDFDKIIKLYETNTTGKPIFMFNVTMQNHGGYTTKYRNFDQQVKLLGTNAEYPMAEQYLSLLHETDKAVEKLINYFSEVDEPTVIAFFGDHQVQVEDGFYEELYGKSLDSLTEQERMQMYATRYFIWTNYKTKTPKRYSSYSKIEKLLTELLYTEKPMLEMPDADVTDSDITESDIAKSDMTTNKKKNAEKSDEAKSDTEVSDNTGSDNTESDVTDSGETEEVIIPHRQSRIRTKQYVTNLSYLSGMIFEIAGLPKTAYQNFMYDLQEQYPVITAMGTYDKEGNFISMTDREYKIYDTISDYGSAIYNRVFDSSNQVTEFFCIEKDKVEFMNLEDGMPKKKIPHVKEPHENEMYDVLY